MRWRFTLVLLAAVALASVGVGVRPDRWWKRPEPPPPAEPDPATKAAAKKLLDGGDDFLKKGDRYTKRKKLDQAKAEYERALAAYSKAYELVPNPKIFYPMAIAEEKLEKWVEVATHLRTFLAAVLAMNCANTFDNADGASSALGLLAGVDEIQFCHAVGEISRLADEQPFADAQDQEPHRSSVLSRPSARAW